MQLSRRNFTIGLSSLGSLAVAGLAGEVRGEIPEAAAARGEVLAPARILYNENPLGPSARALAAIQSAGPRLSRYAFSEVSSLVNKLKRLHGLPVASSETDASLNALRTGQSDMEVLLGVGSSEILRAIAWSYCANGGTVVEAHPGYSAVGAEAVAMSQGRTQRKMIPLNARDQIDAPAMLHAIDETTRVVVVCNPNNPTGTTLALSEIEQLADATPKDGLLLVDEAYIEFLPDGEQRSAVELAKSRENVLIARTFSKIFGLAGMRVGYGLGHTSIIDRLQPFMLGRLSMSIAGVVAADMALDDMEHIEATRKLTADVQATWKRDFPKFGWKMHHSEACFAWVDVGQDCTQLVDHLAQRGVLICHGQRWGMSNYVRISVGTEAENERLLAAADEFISRG